MTKIWAFSFRLDEDRKLVLTFDEDGCVLEADLPQYQVLSGCFLLLWPSDYYEGETVDLISKNGKTANFPYLIQSIEVKEVNHG